MLTKLDLTQLSEEQIQRLLPIIQIIRSIMCKSLEYMPLSVLIMENLIISGIPAILEVEPLRFIGAKFVGCGEGSS